MFRNLSGRGCCCIASTLRFFCFPGGIPRPNYTCRTAFCCVFEANSVRNIVHWSQEGVSDWDSEDRPPNHCFVDVDSPGKEYVGDETGVSNAFQDNIIVVLSGLHLCYLFAR